MVKPPTRETSVAAPPRSLPRRLAYPSTSLLRFVVTAIFVERKTLFLPRPGWICVLVYVGDE